MLQKCVFSTSDRTRRKGRKESHCRFLEQFYVFYGTVCIQDFDFELSFFKIWLTKSIISCFASSRSPSRSLNCFLFELDIIFRSSVKQNYANFDHIPCVKCKFYNLMLVVNTYFISDHAKKVFSMICRVHR